MSYFLVSMDKVLESFIKRARERMAALDLTQKELATRLGVAQPAVAHYLKGERKPTSETIARWADALECSPAHLVSLDDKSPVLVAKDESATRLEAIALILNADDTEIKTILRVLGSYLGKQNNSAANSG